MDSLLLIFWDPYRIWWSIQCSNCKGYFKCELLAFHRALLGGRLEIEIIQFFILKSLVPINKSKISGIFFWKNLIFVTWKGIEKAPQLLLFIKLWNKSSPFFWWRPWHICLAVIRALQTKKVFRKHKTSRYPLSNW